MQKDRLSDTPAYQRILQEGREEGRKALQKELQQQQEALQEALQQQQVALQRLREALFDVMLKRFPHLADPTRDYAETVDDLSKLTRFIVRMATIPTVEGAEVLLEIMIEESKETN